MRDSKLIQLLRKLNKQERKAFTKFIVSPYFNTNETIVELWNYINKYAPSFTSYKLETAHIFKNLFSDQKYNERVLRQLRFELLKLLQRFLSIQQFEKKEFYQPYLLATAFQEVTVFKGWQTISEKQLKKIDTNQHLWAFSQQIQWAEFQYAADISDRTLKAANSINALDNSLDLFFIGSKLKYACEIESWNQIMGTNYEVKLLDEVLVFCKTNSKKLPSFHLLYWFALELIQNLDEGVFLTLKYHFFLRRKALKADEQLILLTYLLNYTFKKIQVNEKNALSEAFKLYDYGIQNNLFILNNQFIEGHFLNIVAICSNLKKFAWVDTFLEELPMHPSEIVEQSTYHVAMARLEFARKSFEKCLELLDEIDHTKIIHSQKARFLSIACHYEQKLSNSVIKSYCKAYISFVKRQFAHKVELQVGSINFCKIVGELASPKPNKSKIDAILQKEQYIVFKDWLVEKVEELFK